MIPTHTSERSLHISPPDRLAKDMLVSTSLQNSNTSLVHLSRTLSLSALSRVVTAKPLTPEWSVSSLRSHSLRLCEMPGLQIIEPVVIGDGSILATTKPGGRLVLLREGEDTPFPVKAPPFPVRASAIRNGVCHLLEQDGSRICMVDEELRLVGVTDALMRAGVEHPTSLCFFGDFIGVLSWPCREAWVLDSEWKRVARVRLPWVDFLCHPAGAGNTLIAVDTPSCSDGPGGLVAIPLGGKPFSLFDALPVPLGIAVWDDLLFCGHRQGLALFRFTGTGVMPLGNIPIHLLGIPIENNETLAITYVRLCGESLLLLCDLMEAGVSGNGSSWIVRMSRSEALPSTEGKTEG